MRLCLPEDGFVSQVLRNSAFNSLARGLWPVRVSLVPCPRRVSPPVPRGAAVRGRPWPAHGPGLRQGGGNAAPPSGKGHGIFYTGEFTKCVTKCSDCPHSAVLLRFSNQPKCAVCSKARGGWGEFDPDLSVCPKAGQELSLFCGFVSLLPNSAARNWERRQHLRWNSLAYLREFILLDCAHLKIAYQLFLFWQTAWNALFTAFLDFQVDFYCRDNALKW